MLTKAMIRKAGRRTTARALEMVRTITNANNRDGPGKWHHVMSLMEGARRGAGSEFLLQRKNPKTPCGMEPFFKNHGTNESSASLKRCSHSQQVTNDRTLRGPWELAI